MGNKLIKLCLTAAVLLQACSSSSNFSSRLFKEKTANHYVITVVPVKMVLTGQQPENISEEQIKQIEEAESVLFQESLCKIICAKNRNIQIQSTAKANRLLEKNGIGIRESWKMTAEELADMLHVDAVVKVEVQKTRYIVDSATYGLTTTENIGGIAGIFAPLVKKNQNFTISGTCEIQDATDSETLWSSSVQYDMTRKTPAKKITKHFNAGLAQRFPYKN